MLTLIAASLLVLLLLIALVLVLYQNQKDLRDVEEWLRQTEVEDEEHDRHWPPWNSET